MAATDTCASCRFSVPVQDPGDKAVATQCRRYPPVFVVGAARTVQPSVWSDGWCGEYKRRVK